jgi:hypothetical protein
VRVWFADESELLTCHEGRLTEQFVGQELRALGPRFAGRDLYYWHREAKNANAEVDYLWTYKDNVIPVEVRAGTSAASNQPMFSWQRKVAILRFASTWTNRPSAISPQMSAASPGCSRYGSRSCPCPFIWLDSSIG